MTAQETPDTKADLVKASHILFQKNIVDAFGHVSARDPDNPQTFFLSRNVAPGLVRREDIMRLDFDGNDVEGSGRTSFLERFIHASIYRLRPDVNAVVHSHTVSVLPFSITRGQGLEPVMHMSGFLGPNIPVYDVRDHGHVGCDMLVRDGKMGDDLARSLGDSAVVLMRGHGMTVVASDVRMAVFRAIYTDVNARVQIAASAMGAYTALTPEEALAADAANSGQTLRAWTLWEQEVRHSAG